MKTIGDVVLEHVATNPGSTGDVLKLINLSESNNNNYAANLYWAALTIIKELQEKRDTSLC